jgi:hypothetical protein
MDVSSQIVPAIVILVANLLSGKHGSLRWETVTAIFGWTVLLSFVAAVTISMLASDSSIRSYLVQICGFCLLTALSRDYERILHPLLPWNR